jgi:hypothetical protein
VLWGINQYTDGKPPDGYFIPMSPLAALAQVSFHVLVDVIELY